MEIQGQPCRAIKTLVRFDQRPHEGFGGSLSRLPGGLLGLLLLWQQRASERTHLKRLSDRDLQNVGLTRADVEGEADKPFWQP